MAEFVVTTLTDEADIGASVGAPGGNGLSLREAISLANNDGTEDSIVFAPSLTGTIRIASGLGAMTISESIRITGENRIVITGDVDADDTLTRGLTDASSSLSGTSRMDDNVQIFSFAPGISGYLKGLTLTGAYGASFGGAIDGYSSDLTIVESSFVGNVTSAARGGGAVYIGTGSLTVKDSFFEGNIAKGNTGGGAISSYGAIVVAENVTFYDNAARIELGLGDAQGGAIRSTGDLTLSNVTITGSQSDGSGGAVYSTNLLTIQNSILLGNNSGAAGDEIIQNGKSGISFQGYNLVGNDATTFDATISANVGNADPTQVFDDTQSESGNVFGFADDNGGPVRTVALSGNAGNVAIDAADGTNVPTTDARGLNVQDIPGVGTDGGSGRDLGAYEHIAPLIVTTLDNSEIANDGLTSLVEAIGFANSNPGADVITFDPSLSGVIRLAGTQTVTGDLTIRGNTESQITISGDVLGNDVVDAGGFTDVQGSLDGSATSLDDNVRLFNVTQTVETINSVSFENIGLTGGRVNSDGAAIRVGAGADLNLTNTKLVGNSATDSARGGAVYMQSGDLYALNSIISGNRTEGSGGAGGAIRAQSGDITLVNTVVEGNSTLGQSAGGGAIYSLAGNISVTGGSFSGNTTVGTNASGGAIRFATGSLTLDDVTFSENESGASGGAIFATVGSISGTDVVFTDNTSGSRGGAVIVFGDGSGNVNLTDAAFSGNYTTASNGTGGALEVRNVTTTLDRVSFIDNHTEGSSGYGGAIRALSSTLNITNGTFVGNYTQQTGALGGAISLLNSTTTMSHVTVTGNTAVVAPGGGINIAGGTLTLNNSIVLGNESGFPLEGTKQIDVRGGAVVTFTGQNIVGQSTTDFDASVSGNVRNVDAALIFAATELNGVETAGVAADNGGAVQTVALLSSANNIALDAGGVGPAVDARGLNRSVDLTGVANGGTADLGAFEVQDSFIFPPGPTQAADRLVGTVGADRIFALGGNDTVIGFDGRDVLVGQGGNDRLFGGAGDDRLFGGVGNDRLVSAGGNDRLVGGGGNDFLNGGLGADVLFGGGNNDRLVGGGGNDQLFGNTGNDVLIGNAGRDTFAFSRNDGDDKIIDFRHGQDVIDIRSGANNFNQIDISNKAGGVLIEFARTSIFVKGSKESQFDADDFLF